MGAKRAEGDDRLLWSRDIVEDSGASPPPSGQDGHLDMWVDGQGGSKSASDSCMDTITGTGIPAIMNPAPNATSRSMILSPEASRRVTANAPTTLPAAATRA